MRKESPANVVVFLADDLGYGDIGCHGNRVVHTPHIDRFAAESVALDRFYVSPVCAPTRASLMTGRWNFRTGVTDVFGSGCEMSPAESTIAEDFRAAGYATALFGKWHLGDKGPQRPTQRGFDEVLTFEGPAMFADQYFDPVLLHNDRPEKWPGYCMDVFTDGAIDFIRRHRATPFFLYLPANLIHTPMVAPDSLIARYDNLGLLDDTATIYAMISSLDHNFGRLRAALRELNLDDNTIIVCLSDNGPCSGSRPIDRYMAGLHGLKGTPYENGIRVPAFLRLPPGIAEASGGASPVAPGDRITVPLAHVDLRPTLLEAAGAVPTSSAAGAPFPVDGRSFLSLLDGRTGAAQASADQTGFSERPIVLQWDSGMSPRRGRAYCVIEGRWKLVQPCGMDAPEQQHIRDRYAELCLLQGRGERSIEGPARHELYDLETDPGEHNDLASSRTEMVSHLREVYEHWFDEVTSGS